MKKIIKISVLFVLFTTLFSACRKDDDNEIPVKPEEAIMSFTFTEATLPQLGIVMMTTPTEIERVSIDLGDGNLVPASKIGKFWDTPESFVIDKPTKGKTVRIKGIVKEIKFYFGDMVSLDVSQNSSLEVLDMSNDLSTFAELNLTKNTNLKKITIRSLGLSSLDFSKNTKLTIVEVLNSPLTKINFPSDNQIETLELTNTQLSQIDLSQCKKLTRLLLNKNDIDIIDVSKNTLLESLQLYKTHITELNLSASANLNFLGIREKKINALVLPASFPKLYSVICYGNSLSNAQMDALANKLPTVAASGNNNFRFACIDKKNTAEKNVISVAVENKIKAKGWKVYNVNGNSNISNWLEYPGS